MKEATSLSGAGFDVHIVALMKAGLEEVTHVGKITIHRVTPRLINLRGTLATILFLFPFSTRLPRPLKVEQKVRRSRFFINAGSYVTSTLGYIVLPFLLVLHLFVWIIARFLLLFRYFYRKLPHSFRKLKLISWFKVIVRKICLGIVVRVPAITLRKNIGGRYREVLRQLGSELVRLKTVQLLPYSFRLHSINFDLAKKAMQLGPDIIQSHDCNTILGGVMIKQQLNIPLVYDSHELYLERNIGRRSRWWDKKQWEPIERKCIQHCDVVMTVSRGIVDHLNQQYGRDDVLLVRNVQPYHKPPKRSDLLRSELKIPKDKKIGLYIGAITFNRGVEELIQAALLLKQTAIVIMGPAINPDYVDELRRRAKTLGVLNNTIFFRGPVESSEVLKYVVSADLGVVPTQACCLSYEFESSNKIFHCVMAGVPLAMSNHIEKRILVEEYGIGVLFDETKSADIAKVIDEYVENSQAMEEASKNCFEAAKELCWEKEEQRLLGAFKRLPTS